MNTEKFYNNYLQNSYKEMIGYDEAKRYGDYIKMNFGNYFPKDKNADILDIGVGNGRTLLVMKNSGYENCFGIDIAEELIEESRKKGLKCEYVKDTGEFLETNKNKYSLIFLLHVAEHIPKDEAVIFFEKVRNSLKKDGVLAIITPNVQNSFYVGPFWDFTHVNLFTERSLYQLCEAAGFEKIILCPEKNPLNIYGKGMFNFLKYFLYSLIVGCGRFFIFNMLRVVRIGTGLLNPKINTPQLICICKK